MVTWRCTATALAALCGAGLACSPGAERPAAITAVSPDTAYNDVGVPLQIVGMDFRPAYDFDTQSGAASVQQGFSGRLVPADAAAGLEPVALDPVSWLGASKLEATLPAGVPAGTYDVEIADPRGGVVTLSRGFSSLGPDVRPPNIVISNPDAETIVGAGTEVTVTLSADDGSGRLTELAWSVPWAGATLAEGRCDVRGGTNPIPCSFRFTTPTPTAGPEPLIVNVMAADSMGNHGSATVPLLLAPRPTLTVISPFAGRAAGGTPLFVSGTDFVPDNATSPGTVVLVDGEVIPTEFVSETQLTATTVAHDPGFGFVSVRTGGAESLPRTFNFYPTPIVKEIQPVRGPEAGGNFVIIVGRHFRLETQIYFSDGVDQVEPLSPSYYKSANRIEGYAPPGVATVNVVAHDPIAGIGQLLGGYVYESSP